MRICLRESKEECVDEAMKCCCLKFRKNLALQSYRTIVYDGIFKENASALVSETFRVLLKGIS